VKASGSSDGHCRKRTDAPDELGHRLVGEGVAEREHRHAMAHLGEFFRRPRPDLAALAFRRDQLGKAGLERLVSATQRVVLGVRNRGRVLRVVALVVLGDLAAQRLMLGAGLLEGHGFGERVGFERTRAARCGHGGCGLAAEARRP
jgi:hypothetical protein